MSSSTIAFLPVSNDQKNSFNFKKLSELLNEMVSSVSKTITDLEEVTEESVKETLLKSINDVYNKQPVPKKGKGSRKGKKSAPTSYILFCNQSREGVQKKHPDLDPKDVTRELGRLWQALSDDEKQPYKDESVRLSKELKEKEENESQTDDAAGDTEVETDEETEEKVTPKVTKSKKTENKKTDVKVDNKKSEVKKEPKTKKTEVKAPEIDTDEEEPMLEPVEPPKTEKKTKGKK